MFLLYIDLMPSGIQENSSKFTFLLIVLEIVFLKIEMNCK